MIKWASKYFSSISPVFLDGCIYVMLGITGVNAAALASDNADKYISSEALFYLLWVNGIIDVALLNLKMFRSTAFADHKQAEKEKSGNTQFINKPPTQV